AASSKLSASESPTPLTSPSDSLSVLSARSSPQPDCHFTPSCSMTTTSENPCKARAPSAASSAAATSIKSVLSASTSATASHQTAALWPAAPSLSIPTVTDCGVAAPTGTWRKLLLASFIIALRVCLHLQRMGRDFDAARANPSGLVRAVWHSRSLADSRHCRHFLYRTVRYGFSLIQLWNGFKQYQPR